MPEPITFWLPAPRFSWREKGRTREARHPAQKGNSPIIATRGSKAFPMPSPRTQAAQAALVRALLMRPERPCEPWDDDVRLAVVFVFAPSPSWAEWRKAAALRGELRPTLAGFGDAGNLAKMFDDALEGAGYITDDAHIAEAWREKAFGPEPGFRVHLEQLARGPRSLLEAQRASERGLF